MDLRLLVLAGGLGTRVRHVLGDVPKVLAPVLGEPFLAHVVRAWTQQGIRAVTVCTGHAADQVEACAHALGATCTRETVPLGTGGAILNAVRSQPGPPGAWLVVNGDSMVAIRLRQMLDALEPHVAGVLAGRWMEDASRYGSLDVAEDKRLLRFGEKEPGQGIINAGVYLFRHQVLADAPFTGACSMERDVIPGMLMAGVDLRVVRTEAPFIDIGTEDTLPLAEAFVRRHAHQEQTP